MNLCVCVCDAALPFASSSADINFPYAKSHSAEWNPLHCNLCCQIIRNFSLPFTHTHTLVHSRVLYIFAYPMWRFVCLKLSETFPFNLAISHQFSCHFISDIWRMRASKSTAHMCAFAWLKSQDIHVLYFLLILPLFNLFSFHSLSISNFLLEWRSQPSMMQKWKEVKRRNWKFEERVR